MIESQKIDKKKIQSAQKKDSISAKKKIQSVQKKMIQSVQKKDSIKLILESLTSVVFVKDVIIEYCYREQRKSGLLPQKGVGQ